jgi:hypothetical protein
MQKANPSAGTDNPRRSGAKINAPTNCERVLSAGTARRLIGLIRCSISIENRRNPVCNRLPQMRILLMD